jgi:unsaturated rhamnogalacturonyl hydrolase
MMMESLSRKARNFAPLLLTMAALLATGSCTQAGAGGAAVGTPMEAGTFTPAEHATEVPINVTLSWKPVEGARGYDVYFGQGTPTYQCRVTNPKFYLETLTAGKTYQWRVDPVTDAGAQRGRVETFKTTSKTDRDSMYAWSIRAANSVRVQHPTPESLRGWNYTEGMVADGLYSIAIRTGRTQDIEFVQKWADRFVRPDGTLDPAQYPLELYSLDRVRPGPVLLWMWQRTKEEKYLKAAQLLIKQLDQQPRTSDGGYWHRSTYPNQMWLDGIYMADVYSAEYAAVAHQPKYFDEAVKQVMLIHKHTFDSRTGLYFHGWDETKSRPWANKQTGTSPELWARAIGWYAMAMGDILDWLPRDHPGRKEILPIYQNLCKSLLKFQDHDTAMWWQIMDKPTAPRNYVETSCSLMFAEAFAKGAQRGWLPPEFAEHARRAVRGIYNRELDYYPDNHVDIKGTVSVGSLGGNGGFYDYYVDVPLAVNDPKSVGTFEFLTIVLSETANNTGPEHKEFPRTGP